MINNKITILGAGIAGLCCAYILSKGGYDITIIEKDNELGGLAKSFDFFGNKIPESYHTIIPNEKEFLRFIKELGIKIYWKDADIGFIYKNKVYNLKTIFDLLRFKPLSFIDRLRFGFFSFRLSFINKNGLKNISAKEWVNKSAGINIYNKLFKPLLKTKFVTDNNISALWLYNRLALKQSRSKIGYLYGGLGNLIKKLERELKRRNVKIIKNADIKKLDFDNDEIKRVYYKKNGKTYLIKDSVVVSTISLPQLVTFSKNLPSEFKKKIEKSRYGSSISVVFQTENILTDYFWLNFIDKKTILGAIINHSYIDSKTENIYYTFTNLDSDSRLFSTDEKSLEKIYKKEIERVLGESLNKEIKIRKIKVIKSLDSKPIYFKDYLSYSPNISTPVKKFFLAGICLYPPIRSMGYAFNLGKSAAQVVNKCSS